MYLRGTGHYGCLFAAKMMFLRVRQVIYIHGYLLNIQPSCYLGAHKELLALTPLLMHRNTIHNNHKIPSSILVPRQILNSLASHINIQTLFSRSMIKFLL